MAWLRVIEGRARGATFLLGEDARVAGQDPDNPIYLDDERTAARQLRFEWARNHHRVLDLNSGEPTTVNGKPLRGAQSLVDQDRIKLGTHLLVYELRGRPGYRDEGLATKGWIKVVEGARIGATYRLGARRGSIGRDPNNLIQVIDDDTSRHHARIDWDGEHYVLSDLGSTNGTKVNGVPRAEHRLVNRDRIEIGTHVLVYEAKGSVRYRDEGLATKNVAPTLTSEQTNVTHAVSVGISSIEIDVEVVEDTRVDESFELELEGSSSEASQSESRPRPARHPTSSVTPEQLCNRARRRIAAQIRTHSSIPEFLEGVMNETTRFIEPDRIVFLFFTGAALHPRAVRVRGQPSPEMPRNFLQPAVRHVIRHKRAVRKNDLLDSFGGEPHEREDAVATVCCAPILTTQVEFGVVYADNLGPEAAAFGDLEFAFLRELGEQLALGLAHRTQRRMKNY